jgi:zinc and cadmium transporter
VSTLALIVVLGVAMSAIAMVGSVTLVLSEETLNRLIIPLVALAAGSLLGGAFLHMLPNAIDALGNSLAVWIWFLGGFTGFFVLEQCLHWHHCHRAPSKHRPLGHLILIADGLHNFIGGLSVAGAFFIDHRTGLIAWVAAAAHEVPQELGDFGILVNSGWSRRTALAYNVVSASTFLAGGLVAYTLSGTVEVVFLVPFAAGNFAYIGATDLLPELTTETALTGKVAGLIGFVIGLGVLLAAAVYL